MQVPFNKSVIIWAIGTVLWWATGTAMAQTDDLKRADSLFTIGRYSEAQMIYQKNSVEAKKNSSNLLLKLAYLSEKSGDYTQALYYLSQLALREPSIMLLEKMSTLASEYGLQGYEFDDYSYFIIFYRRYGEFIPILLLSLGVYVFAVMVIKVRHGEYVPRRHKWALVLYLVAMLGLLNIPDNYHTGIVKSEHTFFRAYPSSAAPVVEEVRKGHRLTIIGSRDHWRMAIWNNEIVYVKDSDLLMV